MADNEDRVCFVIPPVGLFVCNVHGRGEFPEEEEDSKDVSHCSLWVELVACLVV